VSPLGGASIPNVGNEESNKQFFSEEKNQKTFASGACG